MSAISGGSAQSFEVKPYRPDGGFRGLGVVNLITTLIVAGLVMGYVAHLVAQFFYLILIFPCLIGFVLGAIGGRMVKSGHIRNPWLGALAGFLGGVFAMTVMYYADYHTYQATMMQKFPATKEYLTLSEADLVEASKDREQPETFLAAMHAMRSFPAFMDFQAQQGVEISHHGSKGMNLGYYGSYIYWLVEVLIVAGVTLAMIRGEAAAPYCVACEQWKMDSTLGGITGDAGLAKLGVESGDLGQLAAGGPNIAVASNTMLYGAVCPTCGGRQSSVEVKLIQSLPTKDGKTQKTTLATMSWPGESLAALQEACKPAPQEPPVMPA